jgi:hypothetical protein
MGLIGTLLVHFAVLQSVLLGTRAQKIRLPDAPGPSVIVIKSAIESDEALLLVELPSEDMKAKALSEDLASARSAPKTLEVAVISPDVRPNVDIPPDRFDDNTDTDAPGDSGDPAEPALLFDRYSRQIRASIERAWRRPKSVVNQGALMSGNSTQESQRGGSITNYSFLCRVRILQDLHGMVQEVRMLDCNGSATWQKSLVGAILASSPLPTPPSTTTFRHSLTLTFEGMPYAQASSPDDYSIDRTVATPGGSK